MKHIRLFALLLFSMVIFSFATSHAQIAEDTLIVPGVRIGKYALEASISDLRRLIGYGPTVEGSHLGSNQRMIITNSQGTYSTATWFIQKPHVMLEASFRDSNRIETLQVSWFSDATNQPEFKTDKGITVLSRRADVEAAYGPPTWNDPYGIDARDRVCTPPAPGCRPFAFTTYDPLGIAFWFDENGLVGNIYLFRPGSAPTKHTYRSR